MLILIATDRLYRHPSRTPHPPGAAVVRCKPAPDTITPLDPIVGGAPRGTRYQVFRALRAMADGEAMIVEHRIPSLTAHFDDAERREAWFRTLRQPDSWEDQSDVEPILVPGTAFPRLVGRIMLRAGWCAPSEQPHWVPNLRLFFLTDAGYHSFEGVQAWWLRLSPMQRMRLIFAE